MQIGFKLFAEAFDPKEIVRQAVRAEEAGFDFVEVSDHYHPWLENHGHSGFAFGMLSNIAARTETLGLATGVTCPSIRYHPAIVAQAAATLQILSDNRFTLGVGAGERLNEHIVGKGWPEVGDRHFLFREALEIIKLLWEGGYRSYRGDFLKIEDARVFDLPDELPPIVVAAGGDQAVQIAAELGDGFFATDPDPDLVAAFSDAGGTGPRYCEVPLAYAPKKDDAARSAHEMFRFGILDWKVLPELPNPANFESATQSVSVSDVAEAFGCGPDVADHVEAFKAFADAGFDHLALVNAGPDMDAFFDFFAAELRDELAALA